jgi:flagellar hook-associated protein 3 FlgL
MITRVATFPMSDQMIAGALRTEATMASLNIQQASGVQSQLLAGYGANTQHVINLEVSATRAQSYIDAANLADGKIQSMMTQLNSVNDGLNNLSSQLSAATVGSSTAMNSAISDAKQMLGEMSGILNAQYDGQYLFGGARTSTSPVDLSAFSAGAGSLATADTSYYKGDSEIASVRVGPDQTVSYGVTADNPAFEQVLRVLKFVANSTSLSSTDLTSAFDLVKSTVDSVATVMAKLSNADAQVKSAQSDQTSYKGFVQTLGSELTGVDVAAVTAQLSTYQAQLTASFSALAKIQSLNLASFVR